MARLEGNPLSGREIGGNGARGGPSEGFVKKFEHESSDFARATQLHTHTPTHTHTPLSHTHPTHTYTIQCQVPQFCVGTTSHADIIQNDDT